MFRQASSRNHRSKRLKVKHALQIFLLVAVCLWLLYQVKHSHDEKKAFVERNAKISEQLENRQDILKFGRKDLNDGGKTSSIQTVTDQLEEEKEGEEEDDENKHVESDHEERGVDDEIDHNGEEKSEEESENQEDIVDEEGHEEKVEAEEEEDNNEREVGAENNENEEQEESEQNKRNSHEAREANYNGDDASSAVLKLDLKTESENDVDKSDEERKEDYDNNNSDVGSKNIDNDNNSNNHSEIENKINGTLNATFSQNFNDTVEASRNTSVIIAETGKTVGDVTLSEIENKILGNITIDTVENGDNTQLSKIENEVSTNTTARSVEVVVDTHFETSGNNTESRQEIPSESSLVGANTENVTMPAGNETSVAVPILDQNATLKIEKTSDQESPELQSELLGLIEQQPNMTMEESRTLTATNTTLEVSEEQKEKVKETEGAGESDTNPWPSTADDISIVEPEESQTSIVTREVSEALTDLDTLPERDIEQQSTEDIAAE